MLLLSLGKGLIHTSMWALEVFKTEQPISRSLLERGTMVKGVLRSQENVLLQRKQVLGVLPAIFLPRANIFLIAYYFISLRVQAVLFTRLSDLAGLQGDFHHWLPSQTSPFSQGHTWVWLQHLSCGPHALTSLESPQHAEAKGMVPCSACVKACSQLAASLLSPL